MNANIPFILALVSLAVAIYSLYLAKKTPEMIELQANSILNTLDETLKETLEPMQKRVSLAFSDKGMKGVTVKQQQALDKRIATDMINLQDPLIQGVLDMFPNVKEYVTKNPHMLMELLPRLEQLSQIEGFTISDLLSPSPSSRTSPSPSSRSRIWSDK